jgi:hypothetical protein
MKPVKQDLTLIILALVAGLTAGEWTAFLVFFAGF